MSMHTRLPSCHVHNQCFLFLNWKEFKCLSRNQKDRQQIPKDRYYLIMSGGKIGRPLFTLKV